MMLTSLDHSAISLNNEDIELDLDQEGGPTSAWVQSKEAPLFSLHDLENLEGQAIEDIGASTS